MKIPPPMTFEMMIAAPSSGPSPLRSPGLGERRVAIELPVCGVTKGLLREQLPLDWVFAQLHPLP